MHLKLLKLPFKNDRVGLIRRTPTSYNFFHKSYLRSQIARRRRGGSTALFNRHLNPEMHRSKSVFVSVNGVEINTQIEEKSVNGPAFLGRIAVFRKGLTSFNAKLILNKMHDQFIEDSLNTGLKTSSLSHNGRYLRLFFHYRSIRLRSALLRSCSGPL